MDEEKILELCNHAWLLPYDKPESVDNHGLCILTAGHTGAHAYTWTE